MAKCKALTGSAVKGLMGLRVKDYKSLCAEFAIRATLVDPKCYSLEWVRTGGGYVRRR